LCSLKPSYNTATVEKAAFEFMRPLHFAPAIIVTCRSGLGACLTFVFRSEGIDRQLFSPIGSTLRLLVAVTPVLVANAACLVKPLSMGARLVVAAVCSKRKPSFFIAVIYRSRIP
jgi:hypothetical protein